MSPNSTHGMRAGSTERLSHSWLGPNTPLYGAGHAPLLATLSLEHPTTF